MLTTLALALLAATPAQPPELKLTNVRLTVGELGPPRDGNKLLPGDILFIAFDIDGVTIDDEGVAKYTMGYELLDPAGTTKFDQKREIVEDIPLRGNKLPARAYVFVGLEDAPGNYSCKLAVTDPKTKLTATLNVKFEVLKKDFGIVAVHTSYDPNNDRPAPTSGQVGEKLFLHFTVTSFERDPKTKQPDVEMLVQFLDEKGAPLLKAPRKHIQDAQSALPVLAKDGAFTIQFPLYLNRPGKFVVEIKATDRVSKKTFTYKLPITALPAN